MYAAFTRTRILGAALWYRSTLILRYLPAPFRGRSSDPSCSERALGTWCVCINVSMVRCAVPLGISCINLTGESTLVGSISSLSVLLLVIVYLVWFPPVQVSR